MGGGLRQSLAGLHERLRELADHAGHPACQTADGAERGGQELRELTGGVAGLAGLGRFARACGRLGQRRAGGCSGCASRRPPPRLPGPRHCRELRLQPVARGAPLGAVVSSVSAAYRLRSGDRALFQLTALEEQLRYGDAVPLPACAWQQPASFSLNSFGLGTAVTAWL